MRCVVVAAMTMLLLSCMVTPARAETDGRAFEFVARGTVYDAGGNAMASDVWFTLSIISGTFTVHIGMNVGDAQLEDLTVYGSGGTISSMSGPEETYGPSQYSSFYVAQIFSHGNAVSFFSLKSPLIWADVAPGPTDTTDVMAPGTDASASGWTGLAAAVVIALLIISSLLLMDRRR
jgi:hypothetical protein